MGETLPIFNPLHRTKGYTRVLHEIAETGKVARIHLNSGQTFEGTLLGIESDVLAMAVFRDRNDYDYVYLSTHAIAGISINKDEHALIK